MQIEYTVKNYAGVKGNDRTTKMDVDLILAKLKEAGCTLNLDKLREALSYGFTVVIDEFGIELRVAK